MYFKISIQYFYVVQNRACVLQFLEVLILAHCKSGQFTHFNFSIKKEVEEQYSDWNTVKALQEVLLGVFYTAVSGVFTVLLILFLQLYYFKVSKLSLHILNALQSFELLVFNCNH